ncbi:hypothetical protein [Streptomyces sp. NPDC001508]|uniref:hypothetical protein n=1 Tax=Streptomyces sp. NPDC001508 TaxID=3154656 RepID=UPI0033312DB4
MGQNLFIGRPRGWLLAADRRIQQVDDDDVRQCGNGRLSQLLRGPPDVQRGTDACARLVQQCQPPLCPVTLGDVEECLAHAQHPAGTVGQPERRGRPHMLAAGVERRAATHLDVKIWFAAFPHPAQDLLDLCGVPRPHSPRHSHRPAARTVRIRRLIAFQSAG